MHLGGLIAERTVVTGAASVIGRVIVITITNHGSDVVVAYLRRMPREGGPGR
jgi:NAD(P)-dependent dehydrogenase (short-subunit alcohol dehydrogenase family)